MPYKFVQQSLSSGLYEPEGIYLSPPFPGQATILQFWAENHEQYANFKYSSIPLKGHPGIDFSIAPGTRLLAVDQGRVVEIGYEAGGFERYLKVEHRWGESFYAHVGDSLVETGQMIGRGSELAFSDDRTQGQPFLHFAIRIVPYNRFDGWGGFSDPLPYLDPACIGPDVDRTDESEAFFHPMVQEIAGLRRP